MRVGIGTLYRNFATRDALVEAIYRREVETLEEAADRLAVTQRSLAALRARKLLFVDYIATKHVIAPALNALFDGPALHARSGELVKSAVRGLVARAVADDLIQPDIEPIDLLRALLGVANLAQGLGWEGSAKRLVDILIAGSRPGT